MTRFSKKIGTLGLMAGIIPLLSIFTFEAPIQGAAFGTAAGAYGGYKIIKQIPDQAKISRIFEDFEYLFCWAWLIHWRYSIGNLVLIGHLGRPVSEGNTPAPVSEDNIPAPVSKPIPQKSAPVPTRRPIIEEEEEEEEEETKDDFNYKLHGVGASAWDNVRNASFSKQSSWERVRQRETPLASFEPYQLHEASLGHWDRIREQSKTNLSGLGA